MKYLLLIATLGVASAQFFASAPNSYIINSPGYLQISYSYLGDVGYDTLFNYITPSLPYEHQLQYEIEFMVGGNANLIVNVFNFWTYTLTGNFNLLYLSYTQYFSWVMPSDALFNNQTFDLSFAGAYTYYALQSFVSY